MVVANRPGSRASAPAGIRPTWRVVRFAALHLAAAGVFWIPFEASLLWWFTGSYAVRMFPELRWLDRHHWVPSAAFGAGVCALGGFTAFPWGYVLATLALSHATFAINSVAPVWGTRSFATPDDSRNNPLLALLTLGEGWHNNHHHCRSSCRQGVRWWELDLTYVGLRSLAALGIARDLRPFMFGRDRTA